MFNVIVFEMKRRPIKCFAMCVLTTGIAICSLHRFQDYKREWDPKLFKSQKTGRGPLDTKDWTVSQNGNYFADLPFWVFY